MSGRQLFRLLNRLMLLQWRLGLGRLMNSWPAGLGRYMVLGHRGRRTGQLRRTPLNYAEVAGAIYCTAGFGAASDWLRNLRADPAVELWLPDGCWAGVAGEVAEADPRWPALMRAVLRGSGFVAPLLGIWPGRISDGGLRAATAGYRLVQIERGGPVAPGGRGDLIWLWPLAGAALLAGAAGRRLAGGR